MRKTLALLLSVALATTIFAGCSPKDIDTPSNAQSVSSTVPSSDNISSDSTLSDNSSSENSSSNSSEKHTDSEIKNENSNSTNSVDPLKLFIYKKSDKTICYNETSQKSFTVSENKNCEPPRITTNGNMLFYKTNSDLFYRKPNPASNPVKIASNVGEFLFADDGSSVIYKTVNNVLYKSDLKKSTEIDRNIAFITQVTTDGDKILYGKSTGDKYDIYLYNGKKTEKIISGISDIFSKIDFKVIYYIKNGVLYCKEENKTDVKISDSVTDVCSFGDDGVYFFRNNSGIQALCYSDKKSVTKLAEAPSLVRGNGHSSIVYCVASTESTEQYDYFAAFGKKTYKFDVDAKEISVNRMSIQISENNAVFFTGTSLKDETTHLYKLSSVSGATEKYDSDINSVAPVRVFKNNVIYFKGTDTNSLTATLFINKTKIAENFYLRSLNYSEYAKALIYFTDWNDNSGGTLWCLKEGQSPIKIAEKVNEFKDMQNGYFAYIKDYDGSNGNLYINNFSKNSKKIDDKVNGILYPAFGYTLF